MVQTVLDMLVRWLGNLAYLARPAAYIFVAGIIILALVGIFDRERVRAAFGSISSESRPAIAWIAVAAVLAVGFFALHVVRAAGVQRFSDMQNARTSGGVDTDSSVTIQGPPNAAYFAFRTFRRTLTLPREFASRITPEGLGAIAPYLGVPAGGNIKSLVDEFHRSGPDIVFSREQTIEQQVPVRMDSSDVGVSIDMTSPLFGAGRNYFNAAFNAKYVLHNPTSTRAHMLFTFPLPTGSGTMSDAVFRMDGHRLDVADISNGYVWNGSLDPGSAATFEVSYKNQGSRGWSYQLSQRREAIESLNLTLQSNRRPKFARYSVFPTSADYGLGTSTLRWQLKNIVTAQDIGIVFSNFDTSESIAKMVTYMPMALLVALVFITCFALRIGRRIAPEAAATAAASCAVGLAIAGILTWYVPAIIAAVLGCGLAVALVTRALGGVFIRPAVLALVTPIAFLWTTNTSLLLALVVAAALWLLIFQPVGNPLRLARVR
ncbi:MAG: hypothetical protein ABI282_03125 [Candidatus Baltobacteraceae bacterium]